MVITFSFLPHCLTHIPHGETSKLIGKMYLKKSSSIIIITHKSEDRFLQKTLKEVDRKNYVKHKSKLIRIDE